MRVQLPKVLLVRGSIAFTIVFNFLNCPRAFALAVERGLGGDLPFEEEDVEKVKGREIEVLTIVGICGTGDK